MAQPLEVRPVVGATHRPRDDVVHVGRRFGATLRTTRATERFFAEDLGADSRPGPTVPAGVRARPGVGLRRGVRWAARRDGHQCRAARCSAWPRRSSWHQAAARITPPPCRGSGRGRPPGYGAVRPVRTGGSRSRPASACHGRPGRSARAAGTASHNHRRRIGWRAGCAGGSVGGRPCFDRLTRPGLRSGCYVARGRRVNPPRREGHARHPTHT